MRATESIESGPHWQQLTPYKPLYCRLKRKISHGVTSQLLSKCNSVLPQLYLDFTYRLYDKFIAIWNFHALVIIKKIWANVLMASQKKYNILFKSGLHTKFISRNFFDCGSWLPTLFFKNQHTQSKLQIIYSE